jgi:hypothetical protein
MRFAKVFRLHQLCIRANTADRVHCQDNRPALIQEGLHEKPTITFMWIPMAIESAEPSGCQWFIDWRKSNEPRITPRELTRIIRELNCKIRVEQMRIRRPAAVVNEPDDRFDAGALQMGQLLVGPGPIPFHVSPRSSPFPKEWITQRADAKSSDTFQIRWPC